MKYPAPAHMAIMMWLFHFPLLFRPRASTAAEESP